MNTIRLPTGREIPLAYVTLNPFTQRFYYGELDVTAWVSPSQARTFAGYDVTRANNEASDAARAARGEPPVVVGSTSTLELFLDGVGEDVASTAESVRDTLAIGAENAGRFKLYLGLAIVGALAFVLWRAGVFKR